MKTFVEFAAPSFPDTQFDSNGDISVPGGKAILDYISNFLKQNESWSITPAQQRSFYGWEMTLHGRRKFILIIQQHDKWLLLFEESSSLKKAFAGPNKSESKKIQEALDQMFTEHGETFQSIQWFTKQEYELKH